MTGPGIVVLGITAGLVGYLLLRRSGTGWRVGRLLAAAPQRSLAQAGALAAAGEEAYVRLHGRIDSDEEFPGEDGKPLVYRRRRLQQRSGRSGWQTFDDERLAVPFRLSEKGERIEIDTAALGDGLVVVPRESEGVAADVSAEAVSGELPAMTAGDPRAAAHRAGFGGRSRHRGGRAPGRRRRLGGAGSGPRAGRWC